MKFKIYNPREASWWSNTDGWGDISTADEFDGPESQSLNLPIGGLWIPEELWPQRKFFIFMWHHEHGVDVAPVFVDSEDKIPGDTAAQQIEAVFADAELDGRDEDKLASGEQYTEVRGPFETPEL